MTTVDVFAAGQARLSSRMTQVLRLIADGKSNLEIAAALGVSEGTVKSHVKRLFRALKVADRAHAVARAFEMGVLLPTGADPVPGRVDALLADARRLTDLGEQLAVALQSLGWTPPVVQR